MHKTGHLGRVLIVNEANDKSFDEIKSSVETIVKYFRAPLEAKNVELCFILDEMEDAVVYSQKYLNIKVTLTRNFGIGYTLHQMQISGIQTVCPFLLPK